MDGAPALDTPVNAPLPRRAHLLMLLSGFAGLGYQVVWTQQFAIWQGHDMLAVLAVVAAFFGGLAVGGFALGSAIQRSPHPARWYVACECLMALWSGVLWMGLAPANSWLANLVGPTPPPLWHGLITFVGPFLILLPATAAMGATLPAMDLMTRHPAHPGVHVGMLYGLNTLGAVFGALGCAFVLVPRFGLTDTSLICAATNLLCATLALRWPDTLTQRGPANQRLDETPLAQRRLLQLFGLTGLLGIGYEVLVVRVLSQAAQDTVYTYAIVLAIYLLGTALGSLLLQRWLHRHHPPLDHLTHQLIAALAFACLLGTASLWGCETWREAGSRWFGAGMSSAILSEGLMALAAFAAPTLVMGALFSLLCRRVGQTPGMRLGTAIALNTLGAALAPALLGVLTLPLLGPKWALLLVSGAYLSLIPASCWGRYWVTLPGVTCFLMAVGTPALRFIEQPEGSRLISYADGVMASVSVVEDASGVRRLRIDNRQQEGSNASMMTDARQAQLPLLLHPAPHKVLFLGLGTGLTAASAATDPTLDVTAVELLPEVIDASQHFMSALDRQTLPPGLHIIAADARRQVRTTPERYDVIIADLFHPARSGAGSLYTVEHFQAIRSHLKQDGLFCQWVALHQLDLATLRSIIRSFLAVYPDGTALLATNSLQTPVLGLVSRPDRPRIDIAQVRQRLVHANSTPALSALHLDDDLAVLGSFIGGPQALRRFAGAAPLNTDDHPVVTYQAPRITYEPDSLPGDRLLQLLQALSVQPSELVASPHDAAEQLTLQSLQAYWQARTRFIEVGLKATPSRDPQVMLAQVGPALLDILRISPDFRPAYDPLLSMALALARQDPARAQNWLTQLQRIQPDRPEASAAIAQLGKFVRLTPPVSFTPSVSP